MAHLGNIYTELSEFTKAKEMLEKSIAIHKTSLAKNDLRISLISSYLGTLYTRLGEYKKAREIFEDTLAIYKKNFGDNHIQTARILQKLGEISLLEGSLETAESLFAKTLEISQQNKHPDSYIFLESMGDLYLKKYKKATYEGNSLLAKDFKAKANEYFQEALKTVEDYFPKDSPHFKRIQPKIT
jgi:tetratricopeptide (TPR) repeat protein